MSVDPNKQFKLSLPRLTSSEMKYRHQEIKTSLEALTQMEALDVVQAEDMQILQQQRAALVDELIKRGKSLPTE